eukprot:gene6491-7783_t
MSDGGMLCCQGPSDADRHGFFSYRALHDVGVRSEASISQSYCTPLTVNAGELIIVDLKRPCNLAGNGPYLRLEGNAGWVFQTKACEACFEEVVVEEGAWVYQVTNSGGLALRRRPDLSYGWCFVPEKLHPDRSLVKADLKVECGGITYVRVMGTNGWLFTSRQGLRTLREVVLEDGAWTYQVTNPAGLALRRHPTDFAECCLLPEELYPDGSLVMADQKVECGDVTFVHVKDTIGWLFVSRDGEQTLRRVVIDEGLWSYQVVCKTGLAPSCYPDPSILHRNVSENMYLPWTLVWADRKLECEGLTFVRVRNTTDWLFISLGGQHGLRRVVVEYGLWTYKVTNSLGLALRRNPTHDSDHCVLPEWLYPNGVSVKIDQRVVCGMDTFVAVKDTPGWLFVSRDGQQTLLLEGPSDPEEHVESPAAKLLSQLNLRGS